MYKNILVVDNNEKIKDSLKYNFNEEIYKIDYSYTVDGVLRKVEADKCQMIILNKDIKEIDCIKLCKLIRAFSTVPIIMLSKSDEQMSKLLSFEYGADDYLVIPFNILELKARISIIFRRMEYKIQRLHKHIFEIDYFTIDFLKRKIKIKDREIKFTEKEFDLFYILFSNLGKIFSRKELLDEIWGQKNYVDERTVDVHIRRIREKIEDEREDVKYIMTKWGEGYYFNNNYLSFYNDLL